MTAREMTNARCTGGVVAIFPGMAAEKNKGSGNDGRHIRCWPINEGFWISMPLGSVSALGILPGRFSDQWNLRVGPAGAEVAHCPTTPDAGENSNGRERQNIPPRGQPLSVS